MITEKELLHYIGKQPRHIAGFKQIVHDLGIKGKDRRSLDGLLRDMTRQRKLVAIGKERWSLPTATSSQDLVAGELRMHREGYGFVVPEPDSLPARARGKLAGDIFIPPPAIGNAMHGDQVLVELGPIRQDGRAEGRIVRVLERRQETVVGKFHYGSRHNYVTPIDEKVATEIIIPRGMERPQEGKNPHRVLGSVAPAPSPAKSKTQPRAAVPQGQRSVDDLEGMVVEVEIVQWPSATQSPRGRVAEILGREDDFGVDVEIIIRKHHIRHVFPEPVLEEARKIDPVIPPQEIRRRNDYRSLPIVTIDGETARDFDDAVLVNRLANGNYELHVHIADVAHYVEDGSAIDDEARRRGTSVYFPDRAVPMLPLELSTDICSLRPEVDRLVLSCVMEIDPQGEVVSYRLGEGVIRSAQRMTYTDVNAIIEGDRAARSRFASLAGNFDLMYQLAQILNRKRVKRGSIDFDLPEPVIEFDDFGLMKSIAPSERNWAHRLIEEFMLAANETVAAHLEQRVASLYRIHEKPDPKRIYEFESIAASFGYSLGVGALPVKRMQMRADKRSHYGSGRRAPQVELPEEVHVTPRMYQKLVQKITGKPEERVLSYLMLRSLKQARYSEVNEGHFALAAPVYTHFTSPIRRYPDLIIHRILKEVLRGGDHVAQPPSAVRIHLPQFLERPSRVGLVSRSQPGAAVPHGSPWSKRGDSGTQPKKNVAFVAGLSEEVLHDIAESSSQTERAADDAERELLEWKKVKFMEDRLGEEFAGLIVSVTKFGFFVELTDLFIEGLVPLDSLEDDHYTFRENTRQILGARTRKTYSIGDKVKVLVDRIDPVAHKIQFALVEERPTQKRRGKQK
jgi:ribonuclease R